MDLEKTFAEMTPDSTPIRVTFMHPFTYKETPYPPGDYNLSNVTRDGKVYSKIDRIR